MRGGRGMGLAWVGLWAFGGGVAAGLVLHAASGDAIFLGRYTGYVMPWLALGLAPGAFAAWLGGRRGLAALLVASLVAIAAAHAPGARARPARALDAGARLTVLTWNTWSRNRDAARIAALLRARSADVVLLQEVPPEVFGRVAALLDDLYGERGRVYDPELLQGVLSRHPVRLRAALADRGQALKAVVLAPTGPVTVYDLHPLRLGGWRHRYEQVKALLEQDVLREEGPVIVGGDLNAPEHSELYALLAERLANAHAEAGSGLGFTWPTPSVRLLGVLPLPSVVRVDHLFVGGGLGVLHADTLDDSGGSDHRPVFADLAVGEARATSGPSRGGAAVATLGGVDARTAPDPAARGAGARGGGAGPVAGVRGGAAPAGR